MLYGITPNVESSISACMKKWITNLQLKQEKGEISVEKCGTNFQVSGCRGEKSDNHKRVSCIETQTPKNLEEIFKTFLPQKNKCLAFNIMLIPRYLKTLGIIDWL